MFFQVLGFLLNISAGNNFLSIKKTSEYSGKKIGNIPEISEFFFQNFSVLFANFFPEYKKKIPKIQVSGNFTSPTNFNAFN